MRMRNSMSIVIELIARWVEQISLLARIPFAPPVSQKYRITS